MNSIKLAPSTFELNKDPVDNFQYVDSIIDKPINSSCENYGKSSISSNQYCKDPNIYAVLDEDNEINTGMVVNLNKPLLNLCKFETT